MWEADSSTSRVFDLLWCSTSGSPDKGITGNSSNAHEWSYQRITHHTLVHFSLLLVIMAIPTFTINISVFKIMFTWSPLLSCYCFGKYLDQFHHDFSASVCHQRSRYLCNYLYKCFLLQITVIFIPKEKPFHFKWGTNQRIKCQVKAKNVKIWNTMQSIGAECMPMLCNSERIYSYQINV